MADPEHRVYLDYNATAPVLPEVVAAMSSVWAHAGNPSSVHRHGRQMRRLVDEARDHVAILVGTRSNSVTFTSGGTEANATAILGTLQSGAVAHVICSAVEHPSVLSHVAETDHVPVTPDGIVDLNKLKTLLDTRSAPCLICVMLANNETGVIQPIPKIVEVVHQHGSYVLCDAVQAPGKIPVSVEDLGADMLTLSSHKFGGPQGVGALINYSGMTVSPLISGGGQEKRLRSGTENVPGIVGFGEASRLAVLRTQTETLRDLQLRFENALVELRPEAYIHGQAVSRLPNTTCVSLPGVSSQSQIMNLDLAGFSISAGSACSSGKVERSHVLKAMGTQDELADTAIRVSYGSSTSWDDLISFALEWASLKQ